MRDYSLTSLSHALRLAHTPPFTLRDAVASPLPRSRDASICCCMSTRSAQISCLWCCAVIFALHYHLVPLVASNPTHQPTQYPCWLNNTALALSPTCLPRCWNRKPRRTSICTMRRSIMSGHKFQNARANTTRGVSSGLLCSSNCRSLPYLPRPTSLGNFRAPRLARLRHERRKY
jgi:hypothetical protein